MFSEPENLLAAFDIFPGPKGAPVHIAHNLTAISKSVGPVSLLCLGHVDMPAFQQEQDISIFRCLMYHPDFFERTGIFGRFIHDIADTFVKTPPKVVHFRDIWSGVPLLRHPVTSQSPTVFEVNALPSIELPVHFPHLKRNRPFLSQIMRMEDECLSRSDAIITVSETTATYLRRRGVNREKITLIRNMAQSADTDTGSPDIRIPEGLKDREFILYSGVLTPWQGVENLIRAMGHLPHIDSLHLVIAASTKKYLRPIQKLIEKTGTGDRTTLLSGLPHKTVRALYRHALFSVAPLARTARNEIQGCCPLKIVESMAGGTPVLASDLSVTRELITHGSNGWLCEPDSPRALAGAMAMLQADRQLLHRMGREAKASAREMFGQKQYTSRLKDVYGRLHTKAAGDTSNVSEKSRPFTVNIT